MGKSEQPPQSFAEVIETADQGRINRILSGDLARVVDVTTSKASLHESEWKGEITIKIKVTAEPHGKGWWCLLTSNYTTRDGWPTEVAMKDSKLWDGRKVRLTRPWCSKAVAFEAGDVVTLTKEGVVRMRLVADDGRSMTVGVEFQRECFEPVETTRN